MDNHTKRPSVIAAPEINISRACALTIRTRGGFNGMVAYLTFVRMHSGYIPRMVLLQPFLLELLNMSFTRHSRAIERSLTTIRRCGKPCGPAGHVHWDILREPQYRVLFE